MTAAKMDLEYDSKFEEMKKYIPFLENMIKRLESTSNASSNPRQAQLDKIRSLRNLLLDNKKRMKMENLLKCEQVLVNLYTKVEQKDALPIQPTSDPKYSPHSAKKEDKDLDIVRKKLKSVATKLVPDSKETLPEISRASEIEEICTPGSKEPALFQRRPNKSSLSPSRGSLNSPSKSGSSSSKRNYTRVLVSPEPDCRRWDVNEDAKKETPLFSRRSPTRKSLKERYSPSRERKKERKKGSKPEKLKKTKGLNITLNVPQERLDSLNTKDILSRIMNCNDNDMDIETLREAKRQILSELKHTGAKYDDISDLLLKSYKKKSRGKKKDEVEEGELSDSESEAIESIYGGLNSSQTASGSEKTTDEKEQPRKIQICLVINSEEGKASDSGKVHEPIKQPLETDASDFEMFAEKGKKSDDNVESKQKVDETILSEDLEISKENTKEENADKETYIEPKEINNKPANFYKPLKDQVLENCDESDEKKSSGTPTHSETELTNEKTSPPPHKIADVTNVKSAPDSSDTVSKTETKEIEIPLLHETVPTVEKPKNNVSEIDILQALKNEILSESLSIPGQEATTPALHQPKLKKVANAQEIVPKKRISIETYKEKSVLTPKPTKPLFIKDTMKPSKDDSSKKQSLKLTMKECERFNVPIKVALNDDDSSSDGEADMDVSLDDIYSDIAPKSPDNDDSSDVPCTPPVIIPADPVKASGVVVPVKGDIDMRTFPLQLPNIMPKSVPSPVLNKDDSEGSNKEVNKVKDPIKMNSDKPKLPSDPRMRREQSVNSEKNPFPLLMTPERGPLLPTPPSILPNSSVNRGPNMTPIRNPSTPNMTPSMTPNARTFEIDENAVQKHVYAPIITPFDSRERENSMAKDFPYMNPVPNEQMPNYKPEIERDSRRNRWNSDARDSNPRKWDDRDPRSSSIQREGQDYQRPTTARYNEPYKPVVDYNYRKNSKYSLDRRENRRQECPQTSVHPFGRSDYPPTPSNPFGIPSLRETPLTPVHPFGRSDCPLTPSHPFGRSDCPPTPIHPFGRNDCPMTPSHPFGRSDCPGTPSHPFGRSDCPTTPSHPFGRSDCPTTPSHPFGRGDVSMTPNHQFGRSDNVPRDPRLNRSSDYDRYQKNDRERSNYYRDRQSFDGPDNYRPYKGEGRNDYRNERYNKYSTRDRGGHFNRDSMPRREPSVGPGGRAVSRDTDNERIYSKDRNYGNKHDYYSENENSKGSMEFEPRRGFYRERSVGRSAPEERTYRSSSRAPSVGRTFGNEKKLSVKRATGRSFTIDTSVNSTFQEFLNDKNIQVFDYSFDNRRKRAASVGRSLARESSVTKIMPQKPKETFESFKPTKRLDFRRASSMGREIVGSEERSFKDIKADFESFKSKIVLPKSFDRPNFTKKEDKYASDIGNGKSSKVAFDSRNVENLRKQYSPRKNIRDPRVRKEYNEGSKSKLDERNRKHAGIVYSSANITKGTILGSGYGVKNYKIPKIKRQVEEVQSVEKIESQKKGESDKTDVSKVAPAKTDNDKKSGGKSVDKKVVSQKKDLDLRVEIEKASLEKNKDESVKNTKQIEKLPEKKTKEKKITVRKKSVDSLQSMNTEIVEKRVTRLSRKSETVEQPLASAKVKSRKAVIYDSESEEENSKDSTQKMVTDKKDTCPNKSDEVSNTTDENTFDSQPGDQIDSSFGIDDLEIFSDNIVSDPVIDNINALIADLDNELGPTKIVTPTDFSNDIIENMLESITNAGKEDTKSLNEDDKLNDISEVINNDLNQSGTSLDIKKADEPVKESVTKVVTENVDVTKKEANKLLETDSDKTTKIVEVIKTRDDVKINDSNSDDVVTTTDTKTEQTTTDKVHQTPDKSEDKKDDHSDVDGRSTPDSTINSVEVIQNRLSQESLPDSTNEAQNDTNSIVSSTHDSVETITKDNVEPTSSNKDAIPSLNSIGSILDLLQNKSKIKELLSQLGDQASDNEKIKKKLEKLSEIVSDEEDEVSKDCGDNVDETENETKKAITEKDEISADTVEEKETIADQENDLKVKIDESINETQILDTNEKQNNEITKSTEVTEDAEKVENNEKTPQKAVPKKKSLQRKRGRRGKFKKGKQQNPAKRVTRSNMDSPKKPIKKKQSRELLKLQNDIKEMFMKDEILNATGIGMCRLAKLVDGKKDKEEAVASSPAPMVVIEKDKGLEALEETLLSNNLEKKKGKLKPKGKPQEPAEVEKNIPKSKRPKYKPGPKSKTKQLAKQDEGDPYEFESDSVSDMTTDEMNDKSVDGKEESSGSDSESLASSKSFGSSEVLSELKKKPKRKRCNWQSGIIKARRKKKAEAKSTEAPVSDIIPIPKVAITIPDLNCFTDKSYCFRKNVTTYSCRLCVYSGDDIVAHYKENHPHSEIPLSRMDPLVAKEAIEQCEEINFQAISKIPTDKYICRFCYKVFFRNKRSILESFFWHIVSMHTGEYKKLCSECVNVTICPFNLDIPPPPKDIKGQLIGYICEKCNFTQISLENLKTHVIVRHNDEQTEVYTINLAVMTRKTINTLSKRVTESKPRVLRSTRSNQSMTETSDDHSDITDSEHASEATSEPIKHVKKGMPSLPMKQLEPTPYQTKITYGNEDSHSETSHVTESENIIKIKKEFAEESKEETVLKQEFPPPELDPPTCEDIPPVEEAPATSASDDIFDYPHFKISYTDAGLKEYVCCINGKESHYKTTLLISMKKHVQTKHTELWDGYCFICKVIVTPQGQQHSFQECLQHILDNHMDNFPVLEKVPEIEKPVEKPAEIKPYINVRPLSELISVSPEPAALPVLPKIESIVSLGVQAAERVASPSPYPPVVPEPEPQFKYEEVQAEVMSKKHQVVLDSMMSRDKLINVYKCAGRYCSFTSDSVEDALLHASTHNRVGGEGSLSCAYCSFDCSGNAIDLVMHVFKSHGTCPYVCGYCFYRSAAPQLVVAHSGQRHPTLPPRVLESTQPPSAPVEHAMLPRETVVQYYVCPHACKYRTYTAQKFCEHLAQRHLLESLHSCYICSETTSSGVELIQHMKAHDMNVYQCTWCTHGADSEAQLLAHAAAAHPARQPQAYLRLITSKEGTKEFRVLPLASFNKTKVYVEKAAPSTSKDNPVREAERSIELESLIGHTNQMIGMATTSTQPPEEVSEKTPEPPAKDPTDDDEIPTLVDRPPTLTEEERSRAPTPILKTEPIDTDTPKDSSSKTDDVVYCLDSDDEEPKQNEQSEPETPEQNVIDLSDEDMLATNAGKTWQVQQTQSKFEKLPFYQVLKCPQCLGLFKNVGGFKKHTLSCLANVVDPVACAHCKLLTKNRDELIFHYTLDHVHASDMGACGVCDSKFYSVGATRKHLRDVHRIHRVVVSSKIVESGNLVYTVSPMAAGKGPAVAGKGPTVAGKAQKRKSSGPAQEPAAKMKKYGPEDVDRLPINPILDELVHCALCEFNTKVRLNMVRHLQFHADQQPVPHTAPINPVPHLETHEMHFDKMVNLASSSAATRLAPTPTLTSQVTPEQAQFYPKLVPERQRYACGAKDCSYISVNEELFKCHWNTLHPAADQFKCIHCSQNITFDSKTLPFSVIMDHLQMHDSTLYACKVCQFHHYKMDVVTKHCQDVHRGKAGTIVVREEVDASAVPKPGVSPAAPTMDLKPWQCGLCEFKSLIRKVIIDHCGKTHQSKMQFKCANCPFRTSTLENVTKHMANSHPGKSDEVFYYYYKEGSIPNEDGVPKWMKQRQKVRIPDTEIKTEVSEPTSLAQLLTTPQKPVTTTAPSPAVDLNIVKKEVGEASPEGSMTVEGLCQKYGQFCEPNGLNYKCPLCKVVVEDTRDAMQSHLYEELAYRRWVCGTCSYKAFHSVGLNEHIISEHRGQNQSPVQLPADPHIETWVSSLLDHQTSAIAKNKESFAKQKILTERPAKPQKPEPPKPVEPKVKPTMAELEKAFGPLGVPNNMVYCCPKCNMKIKDETTMRNHLESELTKIRWCCSACAGTFQTYHEAQFHCKSAHAGQAARPREAERSPATRAAWLAAVLQVQKLSMRCLPLSGEPEPPAPTPATDDNSLLVVRYEERVPTPEETVLRSRPSSVPAATPGPSTAQDKDSDDDERLVIDEAKKTNLFTKCPHCDYQSKYPHVVNEHIYRHFNLKPFACIMCDFTGNKSVIHNHVETVHGLAHTLAHFRRVKIPSGPPVVQHLTMRTKKVEEEQMQVCLVCEKSFTDAECETHSHPTGRPATFVRKGKVVVTCQVCSTLWLNVATLRRHFVSEHPGKKFSYVLYELSTRTFCGHCSRRFNTMAELKDHNAIHAPLPLKATNVPQSISSSSIVLDDDDDAGPSKRPAEEGNLPPPKRIAKKSTTKLPTQSIAKKSTTKLPFHAEESDSDGEFSFYGSQPTPLQEYRNVTTLMSFCNTTVPFTMDKLSGVLKINPRVVVEDVKKDSGK